MFDIFIRLIVFLLSILWFIYWYVGEKRAEKIKPRQKKFASPIAASTGLFGRVCLSILFTSQLLGVQLAPFATNNIIKIIGFIIFVVGILIGMLGRRALATNWTDGLNYQIKKDHELVTSGIYAYIRHPIYLGGSLFTLGIELIIGSWLFLAGIVMLLFSYIQGKREEKILLAHFGKEYQVYKEHTKMLIPFVL